MEQGTRNQEQRQKRNIVFNNRNTFFLVLGSFLFILNSCHFNENKSFIKDTSPYFTNFYKENEDAVLRNVNFNMNIEEVKQIEICKLYEITEDHLFYEFSYPTDSTAFSEYANVQYFFNENNQLDIISNDIYLNDSTQQEKLKNSLTIYFNQRFGDSEINQNNDAVWTGSFKDKTDNKKYTYTVSLKKLEDDFGVNIEYYLQR